MNHIFKDIYYARPPFTIIDCICMKCGLELNLYEEEIFGTMNFGEINYEWNLFSHCPVSDAEYGFKELLK